MLLFENMNSSEVYETPFAPLELSESQNELVEKFTAAFYTAQTNEKFDGPSTEIFDNFDDKFFTQIEEYENDLVSNDGTDYLFDFVLSKPEDVASSTYETCSSYESSSSYKSCSTTFTFTDLSQNENNWCSVPQSNDFFTSCDVQCQNNPMTITSKNEEDSLSENLELDLSDIEFCDTLSNGSFDIDNFASDICDDNLLVRNDTEFSDFLRSRPPQSLDVSCHQENSSENYGHLLGNRTINNNTFNLEESPVEEKQNYYNQVVMTQEEALLIDDPLLSSSNVNMFPGRINHQRNNSESQDSEISFDENYGKTYLQCKWENCFRLYDSQASLVFHIEKAHVELKRGDEFTCYWLNCPRQTKPFNARYKLLIHMRVHSGEKPNKCPFKGCNKAFSRLENLKIHQRSHTGERPYLCQFSSCTKSFSNSSDRAKHQRTHFDTKPYACQVAGCVKKYTDPSSLRKHVKNHSYEEQMLLKKKTEDNRQFLNFSPKKTNSVQRTPRVKIIQNISIQNSDSYSKVTGTISDHSYSNTFVPILEYVKNTPHSSISVRQDLKNKISEKRQRKIAIAQS